MLFFPKGLSCNVDPEDNTVVKNNYAQEFIHLAPICKNTLCQKLRSKQKTTCALTIHKY